MPKDTADAETPGGAGWVTLVCTALLCWMTVAGLAWLLWRYVPLHVALFEGLGLPLPLATRIAITSSNWFVRLLPFGVVSLVVAGPLILTGATVLLIALGPWWRGARVLIAAGLVVSTLGLLGSGCVIVSIHMAYRSAALNPKVQENLRAFQAFRERQGVEAERR